MLGKLCSFSPSGEKLSQVGPDGILRVWNTATGVLDHEYQPASHLAASPSCIQYSPQVGFKKKKKKDGGGKGSSVVAMGTLEGTILVYSPEKRELLATLSHAPPHAVVDLAWCNSKLLFTLSANNTLAKWNVLTGEKILCVEVSGGASLCALDQKNLCVGRSKIEHLFLKKKGVVKTKKTFTGHTSQVGQLLPLPTANDPTRYFLSTSHDDRYVYAWDVMSGNEEPVASFLVGDLVRRLDAVELQNNTVAVAVTTLSGTLIYFSQHLNGNTHNTIVKRTGQLQISEERKFKNKKKNIIPIVAANFSGDTDNSLVIAYGRTSILTLERISTAEITGDKVLRRRPPAASATKKDTLAETITPKVTRDSTVVGPGHLTVPKPENKRKLGDEDGTSMLPMDERLNALALVKPSGPGATQPPKADNQIHLLLQGLHSKDGRILHKVLSCADESMVTNTVRRLPMAAVVPLLKHLQTLFTGKGHRNAAYVTWVRLVLYHHMSHLSTLPNRQELLRPFYSASASRLTTFTQLTELHARLDLSLTHVATKHQEAQKTNVEPEALLIYREESSDEDEMMEGVGGASESEDNWEELSDFGEVNGHSDSNSDLEDGKISLNTSSKRGIEEGEEMEVEEEVSEDDSESENNLAVDNSESDSDSEYEHSNEAMSNSESERDSNDSGD